MRISDVRVQLLSDPIPAERQWRSDLGVKVKNEAVLVFVDTDEGLTGVGSSVGGAPAIKAIIEHELKPAVLGEDPMFSERIWEKMYDGSRWAPSLARGYSQPAHGRRGETLCAIAGVDIALWDLKGKALGLPVYKLLGAARNRVRGYGSGGWAPGEQAGEEMAGYVAKGFSAVKMRAEGRDGFSIAKSMTRIAAARRAIGDDVELMVDAHGSLDASTAIRLARQMEKYDIAWFEEPISPDDHRGLAEVRSATSVPIATGERETTRFDFLDLFEHRAVDIVQPDIAIAGGFTECRRIAAMASARGLRYAPHAWGSGVLIAASIHMAMSAPNCHIFEVSQGYMPLLYEMFEAPFDIRDGYVHAPAGTGLGFTLRDDLADRFPWAEGPEYVYG